MEARRGVGTLDREGGAAKGGNGAEDGGGGGGAEDGEAWPAARIAACTEIGRAHV